MKIERSTFFGTPGISKNKIQIMVKCSVFFCKFMCPSNYVWHYMYMDTNYVENMTGISHDLINSPVDKVYYYARLRFSHTNKKFTSHILWIFHRAIVHSDADDR